MKTIIASIIILLFIGTAYAVEIKVDNKRFLEIYPNTHATSTPVVIDDVHILNTILRIIREDMTEVEIAPIKKDARTLSNTTKRDYIRDNTPTDYEDIVK